MMISDKLGFSKIHWPSKICKAINKSILKRDLKKKEQKKKKKKKKKKHANMLTCILLSYQISPD